MRDPVSQIEKPLRGGTLFSGIGSPEVAAPWIDWRWCAEIDPFASAVLAERIGHPNLGDVRSLTDAAIEPVDLMAFGSPCQSFSVAGRRAGMDDPRGDLALVALQVVGRVRPRWVVFENVPGLLSSDGSGDFGAFLGTLGQCGYGFAYRILDAQYFGVAQRRRRVFVVGHHGDWRAAAAVLFERESLGGDSSPRRKAGQDAAATLTSGAGNGRRREDDINLLAPTLTADAMGHTDFACNGGLLAFGGGRQAGTIEVATTCTTNTRIDFETETLTLAGGGVRRLTPRECERLQGFPDDYTRILWKGRPAADAPRYRVLGNANGGAGYWLGAGSGESVRSAARLLMEERAAGDGVGKIERRFVLRRSLLRQRRTRRHPLRRVFRQRSLRGGRSRCARSMTERTASRISGSCWLQISRVGGLRPAARTASMTASADWMRWACSS
jgi:DNA (cytosine-5)-methyltransferase 1